MADGGGEVVAKGGEAGGEMGRVDVVGVVASDSGPMLLSCAMLHAIHDREPNADPCHALHLSVAN